MICDEHDFFDLREPKRPQLERRPIPPTEEDAEVKHTFEPPVLLNPPTGFKQYQEKKGDAQ